MTADARILRGDIIRYCQLHKALGLPLYSAVLCDAPYGLSFMGKDWDHIDGVAFQPETWRAIADCLMPGAYLFVFAGNLNDDLISVAMRRAGLVKQHKSLAWSQGSSLPKTTRVDSQVDAAAGVEQEVIGYDDNILKHMPNGPTGVLRLDGFVTREELEHAAAVDGKTPYGRNARKTLERLNSNADDKRHARITAPATPLAQTWAGHRYGSQALRNLIEAILIFRKPYEGKPYECIVRTGAGALNVEGSRIGTSKKVPASVSKHAQDIYDSGLAGETSDADGHNPNLGRHPSNFYPCHTPACIPRGTKRVRGSHSVGKAAGVERKYPAKYQGASTSFRGRAHFDYADADGLEVVSDWDCARDADGNYTCPVALLDEQAGNLPARPAKDWQNSGAGKEHGAHIFKSSWAQNITSAYPNETGGPSRFVMCADWNLEARERIPDETGHAIEAANAVRYQAKAGNVERDAGLTGHFPCTICGEYNTTTHVITVGEKQEQRPCKRSIHPTRKPISLAKYLSTLLACPDAYAPRRLFVPFCGEGSEISGAILSGEWELIVGVDTEYAYVERARAAAAFWQNAMRYGQTDPAKILANAPPEANAAGDVQLDLFERGQHG